MDRFTRYIEGKRVKSVTKKPDGRIVVVLDLGRGIRGKVRVFPNAEAYTAEVQKVPIAH